MGLARSNIQTSVPLSTLSIKLANLETNFGARKLFPVKKVPKGTGKIRVYSKDNLRAFDSPAGRRAVADEIDRTYSLMSFETEERALRELILDKDVRDADADIANMRIDSVQDLTEKHLLMLERRAISKAFTSGNLAAGHSVTLAGGLEWDNPASDPIANVQTAIQTVREALAGRTPDSIAMSPKTWDALSVHPDIVDRVKYVAPGVAVVRQDTVAQVFGLNNIHVLGAMENTADPSAAGTATLSPMLGDKALVFFSGSADGLRTAGFGSLLVPEGGDLRVRTYRPDDVEGEFVEMRWEYGLQFLAVDSASSGLSAAGYLISNTLT